MKQAGLQRSATRRNSRKLRSLGLRLQLSLFLKNVAGELRNAFAQLPQNGPENNTCNIHMSVRRQHVTAAVHASNVKQQELKWSNHHTPYALARVTVFIVSLYATLCILICLFL
jgi:hypothetical protein